MPLCTQKFFPALAFPESITVKKDLDNQQDDKGFRPAEQFLEKEKNKAGHTWAQHPLNLGNPHTKILHVQTAFCQIAFQPPAPQANGRFVAGIFRPKLPNSFKRRFDFRNGHFDNNMILRWHSDVNHGR